MKKKLLILFLTLTLFGVGCAPPFPPPSGNAVRPRAGVPVPPVPRNSTEAAMAAEAGIIAVGVGLTILDIILSTGGPRRGGRGGPMPHPRR